MVHVVVQVHTAWWLHVRRRVISGSEHLRRLQQLYDGWRISRLPTDLQSTQRQPGKIRHSSFPSYTCSDLFCPSPLVPRCPSYPSPLSPLSIHQILFLSLPPLFPLPFSPSFPLYLSLPQLSFSPLPLLISSLLFYLFFSPSLFLSPLSLLFHLPLSLWFLTLLTSLPFLFLSPSIPSAFSLSPLPSITHTLTCVVTILTTLQALEQRPVKVIHFGLVWQNQETKSVHVCYGPSSRWYKLI